MCSSDLESLSMLFDLSRKLAMARKGGNKGCATDGGMGSNGDGMDTNVRTRLCRIDLLHVQENTDKLATVYHWSRKISYEHKTYSGFMTHALCRVNRFENNSFLRRQL